MTDKSAGRIYFNTDAFSERDRFSAFCEEIVRRYATLDIARRDDELFRGVIEMQRAGPVGVSSRFSTPADFVRSPRLLGDGNDSILVVLCRSGHTYQTHSGTELKLDPGEAVLCDLGYIGGFHVATDAHFLTIMLPRTTIAKLLPGTSHLTGLKLDRDDVARRLLLGYLGGTLDVALDNSRRAGELYGEHIVDLIALALGAKGEARELAEQRGAAAVRRAAILRDIETTMTDPNLSATTVARRLAVTPRYVHLLLEETGLSFTQHVLEKRLARAAALLRDPRQSARRIADIALEAGFTDLSHFNRSFRRRFGQTPSDARQSARKTD
jgi:AraC-like DNA-binding protein